ncbi:MAG: histone deacetylase [Nitrospinales bacterium]
MNKTGFIYHPLYLEHRTEPHPENPGRLEAILGKVENSDICGDLIHLQPRKAAKEEIAFIHDPGYVEQVRQRCLEGNSSMDPETPVSQNSYEAALLSAGAGLAAVDTVLEGTCDNVFCAVRPPGHHAERQRSMGFCLFNNVAITAKYAQIQKGLNRILIFDWDVHHGNGTQNAFYSDPSIYYVSAHQFPFYPGTGDADETGKGDGLGTTLNFPLRAFSSDDAYLSLVENKLIPEIFRFKPELVIISAGFDAHRDDPLGQMEVTTECFGKMTKLIRGAAETICRGRLISMLEGGYDYEALSESVLIHLRHLLS